MEVRAVEVVEGVKHSLTPQDTKAMRLPFYYGWDHWEVTDDSGRLRAFRSHRDAQAYLLACSSPTMDQLATTALEEIETRLLAQM